MTSSPSSTIRSEVALVLSGGSALGAYEGGAYASMHEAGLQVDCIAASSIGAVNGAIIAGNPAERRVERLREFWDRVASSLDSGVISGPLRRPLQVVSAMQSRLLGRQNVFRLNLTGLLSILPGMPAEPALYDLKPLRDTLEGLIDFDRLNGGAPRLLALAVDVETGEEVVFDTAKERLSLDHILASASLIPDFPPMGIGERFLVDGGLACNTPVDLVPLPSPGTNLLCVVVDLFPLRCRRPKSWMEASERQSDLLYANQTRRTLRAMSEARRLRAEVRTVLARLPQEARGTPDIAAIAETTGADEGDMTVLRVEYAASAEETSMKSFDFSRAALRHRWDEGARDMAMALRGWKEPAAA